MYKSLLTGTLSGYTGGRKGFVLPSVRVFLLKVLQKKEVGFVSGSFEEIKRAFPHKYNLTAVLAKHRSVNATFSCQRQALHMKGSFKILVCYKKTTTCKELGPVGGGSRWPRLAYNVGGNWLFWYKFKLFSSQ